MNILITTQKVDKNDAVLGFFHAWLAEFSKHFEKVTVVALGVGEHDLPKNVEVLSLGKTNLHPTPHTLHPLAKLKYTMRFYRYIFQFRDAYDVVFVHMNPEYVLLGGVFWKLWNKKIGLWYVHKSVDVKLRLAHFFTVFIMTASKESFQIESKKVHVLGHGIEVEKFTCEEKSKEKKKSDRVELLSVGRITSIKGCDTLLETVRLLRERNIPAHATFVGEPGAQDVAYKEKLDRFIEECGLTEHVTFAGSIPNSEISRYYCKSDIVLNLTPTGGLDKTVIEGMASGRPVFASNETFRQYFGGYAQELLFPHGEAKKLAEKIGAFLEREDKEKVISFLKNVAKEQFAVGRLIGKIKTLYDEKRP